MSDSPTACGAMRCTGTCGATCGESVCSTTCSGNCTGTHTCGNTCTGGCYQTCSTTCSDTCKGECDTTCTSTCGENCGNNCSGDCGTICSDGCGIGCGVGCYGECDNACTACTNTCKDECDNGCTDTSMNDTYNKLTLNIGSNKVIFQEDINRIIELCVRELNRRNLTPSSTNISISECIKEVFYTNLYNDLSLTGKENLTTRENENIILAKDIKHLADVIVDLYDDIIIE